jgi:hypothetical protein
MEVLIATIMKVKENNINSKEILGKLGNLFLKLTNLILEESKNRFNDEEFVLEFMKFILASL